MPNPARKMFKNFEKLVDQMNFEKEFLGNVDEMVLNAGNRCDGFWGFLQFYQRAEFVAEAEKSLTKPGQFFIYVKDNDAIPHRFDVFYFGQTKRLSFEINSFKTDSFDIYLDRKKETVANGRELIPYLVNHCKGSAKPSLVSNGIPFLSANTVNHLTSFGTMKYGMANFELDLVEFKEQRQGFPKKATTKTVNLEHLEEVHSRVMDEALLLHKLNQNSKFFVEVLGINYHKGTTIYYNYGISSLQCILLSHTGKIGQEYKLKWAVQSAEGLKSLKKLGLMHRNLTSSRCFIGEDGTLKIGDLFIAKSYNNFRIYETHNIRWLSPESLFKNEYTYKSEVWSYGVLVWSIYSEGEEPYADISDSQLKTKMSKPFQKRNGKHLKGFTLKMPETTPLNITTLTESCWSHCLCCRPTIEDIVQQWKILRKNQMFK